MKNLEIERKYLIKMPDLIQLEKLSSKVLKITQTYIGKTENGFNGRIRKIVSNENTKYMLTLKKRVVGITRQENEYEIDKETYDNLLKRKQNETRTIEKTRYCINENGFVYEIDIYSFWNKIATMEIELENENIVPPIPDFVQIIEDVSENGNFTNFRLSINIPDENSILQEITP